MLHVFVLDGLKLLKCDLQVCLPMMKPGAKAKDIDAAGRTLVVLYAHGRKLPIQGGKLVVVPVVPVVVLVLSQFPRVFVSSNVLSLKKLCGDVLVHDGSLKEDRKSGASKWPNTAQLCKLLRGLQVSWKELELNWGVSCFCFKGPTKGCPTMFVRRVYVGRSFLGAPYICGV